VAEATVAAPRIGVAWRSLALAAASVGLAAGVGYWAVALRGIESTDDAFVEGHMVFLSPRVGGQVVEVLVEENQRVTAGDALVRLDPADFEAREARARADLDAAHNRMAQAHAAADAAAAQGRAAEVRLRHAEQEVSRAESLFASGVGSRTVLDAAQAARDGALAELHAARQREHAERALVGSAAPVRQAEAALREAELALAHSVVRAPFDGIAGRRSVELGANVAPGQPLVALAEAGASWVTANFKETQIAGMQPGDGVEIRVDAYPGAVFRGRVESLSPATGARYALLPPDNATGNFTKVVQRVPVRISLDSVENGDGGVPRSADGKPWLPVGLSVDVRVRVR
jgi:membrane fusion protein (multidrug efflux system)